MNVFPVRLYGDGAEVHSRLAFSTRETDTNRSRREQLRNLQHDMPHIFAEKLHGQPHRATWTCLSCSGAFVSTGFLCEARFTQVRTRTVFCVASTVQDTRCEILEWICWSLTALIRGRWPHADPFGRRFDKSYRPRWAKLAGTFLASGWRAALDGVQGDQEWIYKTLKPARILAL